MKHWIAKAAVSFFLITSMFAGVPDAKAARAESYNRIWFDSSGNVIGQHAEFCNNYQLEGGDQTGAFSLTIVGGCGDMIRECTEVHTEVLSEYRCTGYSVNNGIALSANATGNYGNFTAGELCELASACFSTEPILMVGNGFEIVQIYPVTKT